MIDLQAVADAGVPMALAGVHRATAVGDTVAVRLPGSLSGRAIDVMVGAGFGDVRVRAANVRGVRARTLPDTVGPSMRVLVCGLNPSVVAADAGVGYATPSNRFWPAAVASGLATRDRDADHALAVDHVGITDLVKRATPRASEIQRLEFIAGTARVERLVAWVAPRAVLFVGLQGWRAAVDGRAQPGWQPTPFGGAPAYVMPSTSGLNAHVRMDDLIEHMRRVMMRT